MRKLTLILNLSFCLFLLAGCYKIDTPPSKWPGHFPPIVGNINPSHGPDSTQVTITGVAFKPIVGTDSVFFNGKLAQLVSVSDTQLIAVVPTLSGTGEVIIKANGKITNAGKFGYDTTYRLSMIADSLQAPFYLSLDPTGNLIVPTYGDQVIHKITPQGLVSIWQPIPYVTGTTFDSSGNLYYASNAGGGTYLGKVSPTGVVTPIGIDTFGFVGQIALDRTGNIYAAIAGDHTTGEGRIDKITPTGQVSIFLDSLFNPAGIVVANDGTVYCTNYSVQAYDNSKGVITKITPAGVASTFAHLQYDGYNGMTIDASNTLYVVNFDQEWALGSLLRITPDGTTTKLSSANLAFPTGVVRDKNGNFYVTQQVDAPGATVGSVIKMTMH